MKSYKWEQKVEETLKDIGIKKGQTVLDFGCGSGNYAIPAARIVAEEGMVYALDKDKRALDELMEKAERTGLKNIQIMKTSGEVYIELDDESVDVVLLYDIFWYFPLTDPRLPKLLDEVYRVTKSDGLISVYPKHIDSERLNNKIQGVGFRLKDKYSGTLIHQGRLETDQVVLNFVKSKRGWDDNSTLKDRTNPWHRRTTPPTVKTLPKTFSWHGRNLPADKFSKFDGECIC